MIVAVILVLCNKQMLYEFTWISLCKCMLLSLFETLPLKCSHFVHGQYGIGDDDHDHNNIKLWITNGVAFMQMLFLIVIILMH